MSTARSETISEQILATLSEEIIRGVLPADERLRQDYIARRFDTSHVPVREALLRLEARGLAISIPRRGVRVAAIGANDIREIKAMRLALEPVALHHAALRFTPRDLARARAAQMACDQASDLYEWEAKNRAFHAAILAPCGMPRMLRATESLQFLAARHILHLLANRWEQRVDRDHHAIIAAIARRDADRAVLVLKKHLQRLR
ncbi:GntR family transcriptional regulator [Amylibacter marinus]|uniref:GntR family transcriptional regulator n=1 Tax=Amylibacter marinus TaxID=1475483 RepID=A0ABQ5VWM6_9RHOB|nr:GntR family transcriptional regulator [Amylibacter marinus]GLQ35825.1 GntR family transcriptional regulator [Amylibacter marinus]